jgi:hypothetical protein
MAGIQGGGRCRRGKRTCRKQQPASRKTRQRKPAYRHPLTAAMLDLLGGLLESGRRKGRRGHKLLWTPLLLCLCAILMSWDPSPSLAARFRSAGLSLSMLLPRRDKGNSYQGWIKALIKSGNLHCRVADRLRDALRQMAQKGGCWLREGWCAFTADSSKFSCPRTAANEEAFGCASKKGKSPGLPQQLLTLLWHMGSGLPWAWESGVARSSERQHLLTMLPLLPPQALLVADAGFVGYDLLNAIIQSRRHFLIRIGSNVSLIQKLGFFQEKQDTVYLWPAYDRRKQTRRRQKPPMALRLIRIQKPGKKTVYLLSNARQESSLSQKSVQMLYQLRWGVEVFFRSMKQTLCRRKLASDAPAQARLELHWAVLGIWVLGLLSVKRIIDARKDPLSFSVALARTCLHNALRNSASACGDLNADLAAAVKDPYTRHRPKRSRNWPRRKRCKPPGRPRMQRATKSEVKMAQEFHRESVVDQFTA